MTWDGTASQPAEKLSCSHSERSLEYGICFPLGIFAKSRSLASLGMTTNHDFSASRSIVAYVLALQPDFSRRGLLRLILAQAFYFVSFTGAGAFTWFVRYHSKVRRSPSSNITAGS